MSGETRGLLRMFFEESRTGSERMGHGLLSTANVLPLALDTKLRKIKNSKKMVKQWSDRRRKTISKAIQDNVSSTCFCCCSLVRNRDMSWPEEMTSLALNKSFQDKRPHGKWLNVLFKLFISIYIYVCVCVCVCVWFNYFINHHWFTESDVFFNVNQWFASKNWTMYKQLW